MVRTGKSQIFESTNMAEIRCIKFLPKIKKGHFYESCDKVFTLSI